MPDRASRPAVITDLGSVLHEEELAADKVLAVPASALSALPSLSAASTDSTRPNFGIDASAYQALRSWVNQTRIVGGCVHLG